MEGINLKEGKSNKKENNTDSNEKGKKLKSKKFIFLAKFLTSALILISLFYLEKIKVNDKNTNTNINYKYFACFCTKARGENKYANELISYYTKLGVEKFIFGDNNLNGTEKLADVLQDYINKSIVDIYEIFGSNIGQAEFYQDIYEKYKNECNWFLFFDFDEYLDVHFEDNKSLVLKEFLTNETFDKCEAILFNWLIYTDNDLIYYDNRTLLERFTVPNYNVLDNIVVKSIVRGNLNKTIFNPQKLIHIPDKNVTICNSIGDIFRDYNSFSVRPPVYKYGYIKHFITKTAEEYVTKIHRGANRNIPYKITDKIRLFFRFNNYSKEKFNYFKEKLNLNID